MITRRKFLYTSGLGAAALSAYPSWATMQRPAPPPRPLDLQHLAQFVDPLPIPNVLGPLESRRSPLEPKIQLPYYRVAMQQAQARLHRDLKPTKFWSFNSSFPGPTIETRSGHGVLIEWANELPAKHFLPIDHNLEGAEADMPEVRTVVHLHGGRVPAESDGYPENWFVPGKSSVSFYPNNQNAATLWYHDHAMGINRLNMYAGLFGLYLIRDDFEEGLGLPAGKYEIPLVFCDRMMDADAQFYYPVSPNPKAPWVPEVFGDAILVNGKITPYLEVEPRLYRFRILNAANGRFFHLAFTGDLEFQQIGTDQGLMASPVPLKQLNIAPGERTDIIVDFSHSAGANLVLKNDTLAAMQFRVASSSASVSVTAGIIPKALRPVDKIPESEAVKTRELSLIEYDDGADNPTLMVLNKRRWKDPVTENPALNSAEIWSLLNTTDDSHPIHLHLVQFQILDRRSFYTAHYLRTGEVKLTGPPVPPDANELGWKDTVRADPGMITRIIVRFEGYAGRYVWHCHILEHGDNEMMRPYEIVRTDSEKQKT